MESLIGVDTNILAYALDPTFPEHAKAKSVVLSSEGCAVNATVVHECYHTLVFRRKISPSDSRLKLVELLGDQRVSFLNLNKAISLLALRLAVKTKLGGRDALLIGIYLHHSVPEIYSHDEDLIKLHEVSIKGKHIRITDPLR